MSKILLAITTAVISAGAFFGLSKIAGAQSSIEQQGQCELSAIRDTQSAVAVQFVHSACNWLSLNSDSSLNESISKYYACLVQNLSAVQPDAAAQSIASACAWCNRPYHL